MNIFSAKILKIGINPYVLVPDPILNVLFKQAGKQTSPIPIRGTIQGRPFIQNLVKHQGYWRLYLNTPMRKAAGIDVGDTANMEIEYDPVARNITMHPRLVMALNKNKKAKSIFEKLSPSLQKEIVRYISHLKSNEAVEKNVNRAIQFLLGKERFIGRNG